VAFLTGFLATFFVDLFAGGAGFFASFFANFFTGFFVDFFAGWAGFLAVGFFAIKLKTGTLAECARGIKARSIDL
jgi:hypothetical protein